MARGGVTAKGRSSEVPAVFDSSHDWTSTGVPLLRTEMEASCLLSSTMMRVALREIDACAHAPYSNVAAARPPTNTR
ncbi:hypothetical protein D9M68_460240 [compost metagenome]